MGSTTSVPLSTAPQQAPAAGEASKNEASTEPVSRCPVDHSRMSAAEVSRFAHPLLSSNAAQKAAAGESDKATKIGGSKPVYDVYGQELDGANMMPATPNQLPSPGQQERLSTSRVKSSIPKGGGAGDDETWTYPSQQMFYNALHRKGKASDVQEADMDVVVAIHNTMNERTWAEVKAWEAASGGDPKLVKFRGRPHDLSPAARWRMWVHGYPRPFDRHDWLVDRGDGVHVRYVIDYYHRDGGGSEPIEIHVRPALDSPAAAFQRLKAGVAAAAPATPPSTGTPALRTVAQPVAPPEEYDFLRTLTPKRIASISDEVRRECSKAGDLLHACQAKNAHGKCQEANVSLNYCMARQICRTQADGFMNALENSGDEVDAYQKMAGCLERFHIMAQRVMMDAAGVKQKGPEFAHSVASSASSER